MSAITKERSPKSPNETIEEAISVARRLYEQIRGARVSPESIAHAIGYNGLHGAALTAVATLNQYGLIDKTPAGTGVTPLAIKILHPKSPEQRKDAVKEAALTPAVMAELFRDYLSCAAPVIEGHLIQSGYSPDRAKRVASIHIANKAFADLQPDSMVELEPAAQPSITPISVSSTPVTAPPQSAPSTLPQGQKMLAQYTIPLGENEATLVFTGQKLTVDDFDALRDFVEFSKRQFERAQKVGRAPETQDTDPLEGL